MTNYKSAGVDIAAGDELVERLKKLNPDIGGFGGLYPLGDNYLVAGTDGVGTKLKLAFQQGRHETVGIDLVAMCANDIITTGASPLFFLDYYATGRLDVDQAEQVIKGIFKGCQESGMVLLGGETAEMPGFYKTGEYDLAGFAVGIVPKKELIDGQTITAGDLLVGLESSGLHSNGYSLVRKILIENSPPPSFDFLEPTRIYVNALKKIRSRFAVKGMAHITGGGLIENVPRMFPPGLGAFIEATRWPCPPVFGWLQNAGGVERDEMFRVFNMGIGMVLALNPQEAMALTQEHPGCHLIGEVKPGEGVTLV